MSKDFSAKFIDIMIGIVLGLGFQWWIVLREPWQFIAFIFAYIDIIDYWIDYGPSLKRFPPKKEWDVLLDVGIVFALFLYVYSTQINILYFLGAFILLRILDFLWLLSSKAEYQTSGTEKIYVATWLRFDLIEVFFVFALIGVNIFFVFPTIITLAIYIPFRFLIRVLASMKYRRTYL